jgi:hypothetical protein
MNKILFLILTVFSFSLICFSQNEKITPFTFEKESKIYCIGDTIRFSYDLDSLEILNSNFGGCGGGPVYYILCHSDSLLTGTTKPSCDYSLMEYWYTKQGYLEISIDFPGIYSAVFFVKSQKEEGLDQNRFNQTLSTSRFEIKEE